MARLGNKTDVIKKLFALSGNYCAFPGCAQHIIDNKGQLIGQICHIEAANDNGERFNPHQTDDERRSFENLILLCANHHIVTNDVDVYTVERLKEIKREHENKFLQNPYSIPEEIVDSILTKVLESLDELYSISVDTNARVIEVQTQITELQKITNKLLMNTSIDDEKIYIAQLDSIKELKKQNKYHTVIDLLNDYRKKNWNQISEELKYKVIANLASAYLDLHETEKGAETLLELKNINYETEDTIAYLILASALLKRNKDFDIWFHKAQNINSKNLNVWLGFIIRNEKEREVNDIIKDLPPELLEKPEILLKIGQILLLNGKRKEGSQYLKKAQKKLIGEIDRVADTKAMIASLLIKDIISPFKYIYAHFSQEELLEINEAQILFSEAWELVKNTELASSRWYIIMNRGVVNKAIGQLDKALQDFEIAYEISKEYMPFKNLLVTYLNLGKYTLAEDLISIAQFNHLPEEEKFIIETFKARILSQQNKIDEAIKVLSPFLESQNKERELEALVLTISTLSEHQHYKESIPYIDKLLINFPENINGYLFKGFVEYKNQRFEESLHNYDHASSLVDESTAIHDIYELAQGYIENRAYDKSANLLEKIVDENLDNEISRVLIHSYYQSGNISKALSFALSLYAKFPENPFLAEILINIYQETNNYPKAISILEQFLIVANPKVKDTFLIKGARLYYYLRDWNSLKKVIMQVKQSELLPLEDAFMFAYLLIKSNELQKGLEAAYRARERFSDSAEAHTKYISVLTNADREPETMFPESIHAECAISLGNDEGNEQVFLITDVDDKSDNVLKPSDHFAKQLWGKKVGDEVIMEKGFGIVHKFFITGIMDKYVYAFRESLKLFETKFASNNGIMVLKANPGQPDDETIPFIKGLSLEGQGFIKQAFDLYNRGIATIGVLARLNKSNTVKQWLNIINTNEVFVYSYLHNEANVIKECLSSDKPIIIDLTTLLSAFFLLPEYLLLKNFKIPIIVAQSVIDELQQFQEELESHKNDGMTTMGFQNGKVVMYTVEKEIITDHRQKIQNIIEWCKTNAQIKTSTKTLELNRDERKKSSDIFGESFYDTILLAQEYDSIVLSDDGTFKKLLEGEYQIKSFSTYQLAISQLEQKVLSTEQINELSFKLILANYIFIPVTADLLWRAFEGSGFQIRKPFTIAVKGLLIIQAAFAAIHITQFLKKLYLNSGLTLTREQTTIHIFNEVSKHHQFDILKSLLRPSIRKEFRLLPNLEVDILDILSKF